MDFDTARSTAGLLIPKLGVLERHGSSFTETWGEILAEGEGGEAAYKAIIAIIRSLNDIGPDAVSLDLDDEGATPTDLQDRLEASEFSDRWRLILRKDACVGETDTGTRLAFFVLRESLQEFLGSLRPFSPDCPLCRHADLVVFVNGLEQGFYTPTCAFIGIHGEVPLAVDRHVLMMPDDLAVRESVHLLCPEEAVFWPGRFAPVGGNVDGEEGQQLLASSELVLAACLASTYGRDGRVGLKGIKHREISLTRLGQAGTPSCPTDVSRLAELVAWSYREKPETRLKLVRDRLSLDIEEDAPFQRQCARLAGDVLAQCQEEYDFVVSDLRSEFEESKRQFLTDLRSLAMGFHSRVQDMLKSLTRDLLAVLLLLTLGIGPKLFEKPDLVSTTFLPMLLKALGIYVLASGVLQAALHLIGFLEMKRLARVWGDKNPGFMSPQRIREYIRAFTRRSQIIFIVFLFIWSVVYVTIGLGFLLKTELIKKFVSPPAPASSTETSLRGRQRANHTVRRKPAKRPEAWCYGGSLDKVTIPRDGDMLGQATDQWVNFRKAAETIENEEEARTWLNARLAYLPGDTWPEKWIIQTLRSDQLSDLQDRWNVEETTLGEALREANQAGKHDELRTLASELELDESCVSSGVAQHLARNHPEDFEPLGEKIKELLD